MFRKKKQDVVEREVDTEELTEDQINTVVDTLIEKSGIEDTRLAREIGWAIVEAMQAVDKFERKENAALELMGTMDADDEGFDEIIKAVGDAGNKKTYAEGVQKGLETAFQMLAIDLTAKRMEKAWGVDVGTGDTETTGNTGNTGIKKIIEDGEDTWEVETLYTP